MKIAGIEIDMDGAASGEPFYIDWRIHASFALKDGRVYNGPVVLNTRPDGKIDVTCDPEHLKETP